MRRGRPAGGTRAAHSLKSTAGNLGARALQDAAEQAEDRAAAEDGEAIPPLLDELEARYAQARAALEAERRRRRPS
ncbi:MAG: Hpt domain-containing protein [Gemmatimonadota bacterium]